MPVWLVTGGSGFIGRQVLANRSDVLALGRNCPGDWPHNRCIAADLEDPDSLALAVRECRPDVVIHAAGRTPPGDPGLFYRANTLAMVNLLDALRREARPVRVVVVGSAAELGSVDESVLPVSEDHPCHPADAYGLSKWLATCAALAASAPLEVMVGRVFNPIGPGQSATQAFGRFAARLAEESETLIVGDLEGRRDFIDVRDVARALIALAEKGRPGLVYHIGTGQSLRVGDGLDYLLRKSGRQIRIEVQPGPQGPRDSRADISRITSHTGWRPEIDWEQSLDDLWNEADARARLTLTA